MSNGFKSVTLHWDGETYTIPANQVFPVVQQVEDALIGAGSTQALYILLQPEGPPNGRLAKAFGAALRYAGATVGDDEIYLKIVGGIAEKDMSVQTLLRTAVLNLLQIVAPPVAAQMALENVAKREPEAKK